jgi:Tol biopolymer transport system component
MSRMITSRRIVAMMGVSMLTASAALAMPQFGEWAAPQSIEAPSGASANLNSPAVDGCASLSPDGLMLAFNSNRTGNFDIYIARRGSTAEGFGEPERLPAPINGPATENCPTLIHGKQMIFTSTRDDSQGDLYLTRIGPKGWAEPARFDSNINEPGIQDEVAAVFEDDEGRQVMLWSRRNGSNPGDIFQSIDGGPATLVQGGVNSSAGDNRPSVTHDGKTIFWDSTRNSDPADPDLWYATRSSTSDTWGSAERLTSLSVAGTFDARPFVSWDGTTLIFSSARPGGTSPAPDMYFTTR